MPSRSARSGSTSPTSTPAFPDRNTDCPARPVDASLARVDRAGWRGPARIIRTRGLVMEPANATDLDGRSEGRSQEAIPPQGKVPGGPRTPLDIGKAGWR